MAPRQVERARVVLLVATGQQDLEIAAEVGVSNQITAIGDYSKSKQ